MGSKQIPSAGSQTSPGSQDICGPGTHAPFVH
jgi:hypothetical protein